MGSQSDSDKAIVSGIGEELRDNPPRVLAKTRRKSGAARAKKQKTAILLSKARRAGAHIPLAKGRHK